MAGVAGGDGGMAVAGMADDRIAGASPLENACPAIQATEAGSGDKTSV
ncbi:MAG: hypothetical protein JOZ32_02365 [Bryobacterales bacterium]|nr:hypothetical protein [Bryobacterales bacterium]